MALLLHHFQFAFEAAHFLDFRGLMSTAWEGFGSVPCQLLTPLMDRRIGNPQVASDVRNRLPTGLSQSHRFTLKFGCVGLLNLLHDPGPPSGIVYPKLSLLHKFGVRSDRPVLDQ